MITSAPLRVFEFLQLIEAKFFSNKVFPINMPKPSPDFSLFSLFGVVFR